MRSPLRTSAVAQTSRLRVCGAVSDEIERVSQRVPQFESLWLRIGLYLVSRNCRRAELGVSIGRVASCSIIETVNVRDDENTRLTVSA